MGKWDEADWANWLAQFQYQQDQDEWERQKWQTQWDASQQADRQSTAYKMATAMLENGLLPDSGTLAAAGISPADAQAYVSAVQGQMAAKSVVRSGGSGSGSSGGAVSSGKPKLTYSQALSAIENGQVTDAVKQAYDYYMGPGAYQQYYGQTSTAAQAGVGQAASPVIRTLTEQLNGGNEDRVVGYLDSIWDGLTAGQKQEVQRVLARYGREYGRS